MTTEASKPVKPLTAPAKTAPAAAVKPAAKSVKVVASKVASKTAKAPTSKPKAVPAPKVTAKSVSAPQAAKDAKVKKPKMVRDSFTFPKDEYAVLDLLKLRAAKLGSPVKKTELLRAGVKAIAAMADDAFLLSLRAVPSLKTGRPAKSKSA